MRENEFGDTTRKLWLWLAAEGGYSTAAEVAAGNGVDRKTADNVLANMKDSGYVKRIRTTERLNGVAYGVTSTCRPPRGVPQPVLDQLGFGEAAQA